VHPQKLYKQFRFIIGVSNLPDLKYSTITQVFNHGQDWPICVQNVGWRLSILSEHFNFFEEIPFGTVSIWMKGVLLFNFYLSMLAKDCRKAN